MTKEKFLEKFSLCKFVLVGEECYEITNEERLKTKAEKTYETLKQVIKMKNIKSVSIIEEGRINEELKNFLEVGIKITLYFDEYDFLDYQTYMALSKLEYKNLRGE